MFVKFGINDFKWPLILYLKPKIAELISPDRECYIDRFN